MTALAKSEAGFTAEQTQIVKQVLCPGISDAQLAMFAQVCKRTGLDPFARQIYATIRNANEGTKENPKWVKKLTIQTGIDGFRLIAERTDKYSGQGEFEWCGPDGVWRDIWLDKEPPAAARATVYRSDWKEPIRRIARWKAYNQDNSMWRKMDAEQLAKCAEALCLRAAFPQDLSGLYTDDEMAQADVEPIRAAVVPSAPKNALPANSEPDADSRPGDWQPRHERVWKLYANSSVVDQPITSIPEDKLNSYIERLEKTMADHRPGKPHQNSQEAKPYHAAAVNERQIRERLKREAEAEAAGADPETGEVLDRAEDGDAGPVGGAPDDSFRDEAAGVA